MSQTLLTSKPQNFISKVKKRQYRKYQRKKMSASTTPDLHTDAAESLSLECLQEIKNKGQTYSAPSHLSKGSDKMLQRRVITEHAAAQHDEGRTVKETFRSLEPPPTNTSQVGAVDQRARRLHLLAMTPERYLDLLGKPGIRANPFGNKTAGQELTHKSGLKRCQKTQNIEDERAGEALCVREGRK